MSEQPLSVRMGAENSRFDQLHDGIPDWLRPSVDSWLQSFLPEDSCQLVQNLEVHLRAHIPIVDRSTIYQRSAKSDRFKDLLEWSYSADRTLDVLDYVLRNARRIHLGDSADLILRKYMFFLENSLRTGGSAWTVGTHGQDWELQRRISHEAQAQLMAAITASADNDRHLERAWSAAFGRQPDPSTAYREAVNAVEHVACRLVVPNNQKAGLGDVAGELRNNSRWKIAFRTNPNKKPMLTPIEVLAANCELLGNSDPRHGNDSRGVPTPAEAEAAVHLAVLLVSWFTNGGIQVAKKP